MSMESTDPHCIPCSPFPGPSGWTLPAHSWPTRLSSPETWQRCAGHGAPGTEQGYREEQDRVSVLLLVKFSRETGSVGCICTNTKRFIMRAWLMSLWRQRNPMIWHLQAGGPGQPVVWFQLNPQAQEPGEPVSKCRRRQMFQLKERGQLCPSSDFLFYRGPQLTVWCTPALVGADLLSLVYWCKC